MSLHQDALIASFVDELEKISSQGGFFSNLSGMLPSFMRSATPSAAEQASAVAKQVKSALPPRPVGSPDPRAQLAAMKEQHKQMSLSKTLSDAKALDEDPRVKALRERLSKTAAEAVYDKSVRDVYRNAAPTLPSLEKGASIEYRGTTFPGYNKPIPSNRKGKKKMVLVKRGDKVKLVHFGQKGYQDFTQHKDPERRKNYLARSGGIRGKGGKLTASDPFSANYWARKELW